MSNTGPSAPSLATEPLDNRRSAVRFETRCVVIPDPAYGSRRPRVVTKSYAVPLWKRRTTSADPSTPTLPEDAFFEENQPNLVVRVPLPTFSLKPRLRARSVDEAPLPSCLVQRSPTVDPSCPPSPLSPSRPARASRKSPPSPFDPDILTVPLRPCCKACQAVTEAAFAKGDAWTVRFSRAASRLRSANADSGTRTITVAGSAASASYGDRGVSINVDEVDKRRRSNDIGSLIHDLETLWSDDGKINEEWGPLFLRLAAPPRPPATATRSPPPPPPARIAPTAVRIPEEEDDEDENKLFPLPSPKRTPTASPVPSPARSPASLAVAKANQRSASSPAPSSCSGDSAGLHPIKQRFFTPPSGPSTSSFSLPSFFDSMPDLSLTVFPIRSPSPDLLSTLPAISRRSRSPSPSASPTALSASPASANTFATAPENSPPKVTQLAGSVVKRVRSIRPSSAGSPLSPKSPASPASSPPQSRFPWRRKRTISGGVTSPTALASTPSLLPSTSPSPTKKSFAIPNLFTGALRGVGSMGSSGAGHGF